MVCFSHLKKFVLYASLSLLGLLFGTVIINVNNSVYAVDDVTITVDSSTSENQTICHRNLPCSDFNYLYVTSSSFISSDNLAIAFNGIYSSALYFYGPSFVYDISSFSSSINYINVYQPSSLGHITSGNSFTVTLSENNPFGSGITPSGSLSITENGTYDVSQYAEAVVNVPTESAPFPPDGSCDYTASLEAIRRAILTCGAILLLIYFFYCIYRIIIKSTGGN